MIEPNSCLASQCMEFTKHMVSKGMAFKFSLSLPTGFIFSMDFNQEKVIPKNIQEKKKRSPSTLKRNNLRKKEFLTKKAEQKQAETQLVIIPAQSSGNKFNRKCENEFKSKDTLDINLTEEHNAALTCQECDHISETPENIKEHIKESHSIEQLDGSSETSTPIVQKAQLLKCEHCDLKAETTRHLKKHMNFKHQGFKCYYCEYKNISKDILNQHTKKKHKNQSNEKKRASPFTCTYCGEVCEDKIKHHCHEVYCPKRV